MKNLKFLYLGFAAVLAFGIVGCSDDDDDHDHDNKITITIDEPMNDDVIADCDHVHIHIEIEATDENHNVEVVLHPEGDVNDKILDIDMHSHDQKITIMEDRDLCSYGSGACFHLEVEACVDHDCEEKETAEVEFCLQ